MREKRDGVLRMEKHNNLPFVRIKRPVVARIELLSSGAGRLIDAKRINGMFIARLTTADCCDGQARN